MNNLCIRIVNDVYKTMRENIDIINDWFEADNSKLDTNRLFRYEKEEFNLVIGNEQNIYIFVNKLINNLLCGKEFKLNDLTYLEYNFVSLANVVIESYKNNR